MRVGIYDVNLAPGDGGGHTYQRDVIDALARARESSPHDLFLIGPVVEPPPGWNRDSFVSLRAGVASRGVGLVRRRLRPSRPNVTPRPTSRVDELLLDRRIDLVWCVGPYSLANVLPYVVTIWDLQHRRQPVFPEVSGGGEWQQREQHFASVIGRAAAVIVGTRAGQEEVERFYGVLPERVHSLAHPTPGFALAEPTRSTDILAKHKLEPGYVLYPAQFWAHKNHVGLLRALKRLREEHGLLLHAVFVGSDKGTEAHVRRAAAELGLAETSHFLGFVPRNDLVALYQQAFALAYVTFFGPENLPPLEAFALGCPVVASDVPGAQEQLGDAAILVPPIDEGGIAAALLRLHRDPTLRASLIEKGYVRARAYTPDDYARGVLGVIDRLEPMIRTWR